MGVAEALPCLAEAFLWNSIVHVSFNQAWLSEADWTVRRPGPHSFVVLQLAFIRVAEEGVGAPLLCREWLGPFEYGFCYNYLWI